jgi:hypothetical protein
MRSRRIDPPQADDDVITSAPREVLAIGYWDEAVVSGLDEAIASIRRRTARLAYLVIRREYLDAWCEACDLKRTIDAADVLAFAVLELSETSDRVRRLDEARRIADAVLQLAPAPSPTAIGHAFAPTPHADRSLWEREEAQWRAERVADLPSVPVGHSERARVSRRAGVNEDQ